MSRFVSPAAGFSACIDTCIDVCLDACLDACLDICVDACLDTCLDAGDDAGVKRFRDGVFRARLPQGSLVQGPGAWSSFGIHSAGWSSRSRGAQPSFQGKRLAASGQTTSMKGSGGRW